MPPVTVTSEAVKVVPTLCEKSTEKGMGAVLVGLAEVVLTVAVRAAAVTANVAEVKGLYELLARLNGAEEHPIEEYVQRLVERGAAHALRGLEVYLVSCCP